MFQIVTNIEESKFQSASLTYRIPGHLVIEVHGYIFAAPRLTSPITRMQ